MSRAPITLVTGGAGSGKTTAALWTARKALESDETPQFARALFLTFSRTAVEQIAERSQRVGELEVRVEIATFHAFAMRTLRAFGRYAGHGRTAPTIQSEAHKKLFGADPNLLTYDELVPGAIEILRSSSRLRALAAERWPIVICDEFQDTSDDQWDLLTLLGETARLVLLADPHQMIYTFVPGVGPERLTWAEEAAGDAYIQLEEASHRDPSGVIPAMASAVRERAFDHPAVLHALDTGALRIRTVSDDELIPTLIDEIRSAHADGLRSVGIYGHSNDGVARMGAAMTDAGVVHTLVGIPEAQGEGLNSLLVLTKYGYGAATIEEARIALAIFLTACVRGDAPPLAVRLAHGQELPRVLDASLEGVLDELIAASRDGISAVASVAANAWDELAITAGRLPWRRASYGFLAVVRSIDARRAATDEGLAQLEASVNVLRSGALTSQLGARSRLTTLMNFHQTKGREADAVVLVYRDGDYLTHYTASEPFRAASRVLYVSLTRARRRVTVILPSEPHPLIAPFSAFG
jgi:DNA helicase-2/ATP-dependent DNA helicase PcrA